MNKIYVEDVIVSGTAKDLQKAINEGIKSADEKGRNIEVISVLYIGNNPNMERIYQIVYKYN